MYFTLFLFTIVLLWIAVANFLTIRRPQNLSQVDRSVTVLIPVRNEAENIVELIDCLTKQSHLSSLEIVFIDDSSTDSTKKLLKTAISEGAPIIVTLDADVRVVPTAMSQGIAMMGERDFISPYPRQIAKTFAERLVQPLLQWSWMTTVPLRLAERSNRTSLAVANGQFFLVKKSSLDAIGGFTSIATEVLDDMKLARALIATGAHGGVADGSTLAQTRMYKNFDEIKAGYGKSLWSAFSTPLGSGAAIAFIFVTGLAPVLIWFSGNPIGLFTYEVIVITRIISAKRSGGKMIDSFLHPISSAILIYLIIYSWRARGKVQWKGRTL